MTAPALPAGSPAPPDFDTWLDELRREAAATGISPATLTAALDGLQPLPEVIELDRRQPEFNLTFWRYMDQRITDARIKRGRKLLAKHERLLWRVYRDYEVQPRFLVAFWGLESGFGDNMGDVPVIAAVATLAHDRRRSEFFRDQLLDALRIVEDGHATPAQLKGSWAGAMGQLQFLPSTFLDFAVDRDKDGRRDIWRSQEDVFASAANYLKQIGWRGRETWGREVRLPAGFDLSLADLAIRKPIAEWQRLGVRRADGKSLPKADMAGSIVLPGGILGPAFLVYDNFRAILVWNRSVLYALSVGHLADRLIGGGPLVAERPPEERPLHRDEVVELQSLLVTLGFDPGEADGVVGSRTRAAIRSYQRQANLPADGYPTEGLLQGLRKKAAN